MAFFWGVMVAKKWEGIELQSAGPLAIPFPASIGPTPPGEPTHWMPLFESREEAVAWAQEGGYQVGMFATPEVEP